MKKERNFFYAIAILWVAFFACIFFIGRPPAYGGTLNCTITTSTCNPPSVVVLRLASTTNSHSELPVFSDYPVMVCCEGVGSLGTSCNGVGATTTFLHLASSTNSHVEENTQNNYPSSSYACLSVGPGGSVSVGYVTTTTCQGAGYDTALVSIASSTNSHAAMPGSSTFQAGSTIQVCASATTPPAYISNILLNNGAPIILTPNATTTVTLGYTINDWNSNGCSDIFTSGNVTSTAFLDTVSSTCENSPTANNLNCYVSTLAGSVNSCGGSSSTSATATDTFNIYYLAASSGVPSSSYPMDHWYGYVSMLGQSGATSTAFSAAVDINVLSALNVSTSSISFGSLRPNNNTGAVDQTVVVSNAGNTSDTIQLSGTNFTNGANSFATSSEHYATSSFTFGGVEQQMNSLPTTISGLTLTAPHTVGNNPSSTIYFGLQVPNSIASGTYTASDTFTGVFSQ
jgi:hypothetical protein